MNARPSSSGRGSAPGAAPRAGLRGRGGGVVRPPASSLAPRAVRRAGLDYWPEVELRRHRDLEALRGALPRARFLYLTTKAERSYADWAFATDDCLVFGPETRGLPEELLRANWERCLTIPMLNPKVRSLNLATSVAVVLYEALRQTGALKKQ